MRPAHACVIAAVALNQTTRVTFVVVTYCSTGETNLLTWTYECSSVAFSRSCHST